ncbi:ABC transporter ATP-binding protein [Castellaniella ginsengisoli]|uniref:ABC transporter ATP-binding protein n=1 Tax=Castellaniella ginsengisoli TaxID=546114 RepID=A0AB39FST4_9BURK
MIDPAAEAVLRAEHLAKTYDEGAGRVEVLRDVNLAVYPHEMIAVVGASGSGKSTLLHLLGLLEEPDEGRLWIAGQAATGLDERRRSRLRNQTLGFVYQFHHLLPEFSALDNVAMPLIVRRMARAQARERAAAMLDQVGLAARAAHFPGQLSGGERQRVALARALVTRPVCVLADEPTGNLDRHTADAMFALLTRINQDLGTAFVIVTHDPALAALAHRRFHMQAGLLAEDTQEAG